MTAPELAALADRARTEAEKHPPRSPQRRAAAEVWTALMTTGTGAAARKVLLYGGDPAVRATALKMLDKLAGQQDGGTTTEETPRS